MLLTILTVITALLCVLAVVSAIGAGVIERAHPPAGRLVEVTGGRLHVVELGPRAGAAADAPAVVLLHGASGNLEDMRLALGERLSEKYRVILVDRPGHGWSERSDSPDQASPAHQAAPIREALGQLGITRVILVAHSFAGAVATAYALDHPENVAGLVLLAPVTHPWSTGIAWYYMLATTPVLGPLFARTLAMPLGAILVQAGVQLVFSPQTPPEGYVRRSAVMLGLRPGEFLANARDVAGLLAFVIRQAARYRNITAPTFIIAGDEDITVSPRLHARALAAAVPNATLVMLVGVGHMPHYAAPDRIEAAIAEMAKRGARRDVLTSP
jgi:pimeloyl-ACP methyl ester carboxylesterase